MMKKPQDRIGNRPEMLIHDENSSSRQETSLRFPQERFNVRKMMEYIEHEDRA